MFKKTVKSVACLCPQEKSKPIFYPTPNPKDLLYNPIVQNINQYIVKAMADGQNWVIMNQELPLEIKKYYEELGYRFENRSVCVYKPHDLHQFHYILTW